MIQREQAGDGKTKEQGNEAKSIYSDDGINFRFSGSANKSIESSSGKVSSNTRVTSRRVTWSYKCVNRESKAFELAGMNTSGMHRAQSWSGPSVDSLIMDADGHGVSTVDGIDYRPTKSVALKRISYSNTFIKELNFRTMKHKVEADSNECTPHGYHQGILKAVQKEFLNVECDQSYIDNPCRNGSRLRSKDFEISHGAILAQLLEEKING